MRRWKRQYAVEPHLASLFRCHVQSPTQSRVARGSLGALNHDTEDSQVVCSDLPVHQMGLHSVTLAIESVLRGCMEVELEQFELLAANYSPTRALGKVDLHMFEYKVGGSLQDIQRGTKWSIAASTQTPTVSCCSLELLRGSRLSRTC